jgi:hypothetical protein
VAERDTVTGKLRNAKDKMNKVYTNSMNDKSDKKTNSHLHTTVDANLTVQV